MAYLEPDVSFTPAAEKAFGKEHVQHAQGGVAGATGPTIRRSTLSSNSSLREHRLDRPAGGYQRLPLMDLYSAEAWPYWPFTLVFTPSKTNLSPAGPV